MPTRFVQLLAWACTLVAALTLLWMFFKPEQASVPEPAQDAAQPPPRAFYPFWSRLEVDLVVQQERLLVRGQGILKNHGRPPIQLWRVTVPESVRIQSVSAPGELVELRPHEAAHRFNRVLVTNETIPARYVLETSAVDAKGEMFDAAGFLPGIGPVGSGSLAWRYRLDGSSPLLLRVDTPLSHQGTPHLGRNPARMQRVGREVRHWCEEDRRLVEYTIDAEVTADLVLMVNPLTEGAAPCHRR